MVIAVEFWIGAQSNHVCQPRFSHVVLVQYKVQRFNEENSSRKQCRDQLVVRLKGIEYKKHFSTYLSPYYAYELLPSSSVIIAHDIILLHSILHSIKAYESLLAEPPRGLASTLVKLTRKRIHQNDAPPRSSLLRSSCTLHARYAQLAIVSRAPLPSLSRSTKDWD